MLTWQGADNVLVVGKVDDAPYAPRLKLYTQDRDHFTQAATSAFVTGVATYEQTVPHLTRDSALPAQHVSFTSQATTDDVQPRLPSEGHLDGLEEHRPLPRRTRRSLPVT